MKINKDTSNPYTHYEKYNKQYYVYCTGTAFARIIYFFHNHLELNYKSFYLSATLLDVTPSHHYSHDIFQLIYHLTIFYTYSLNILNILKHDMIYHIHIYNS